jgi:hypothetical protein
MRRLALEHRAEAEQEIRLIERTNEDAATVAITELTSLAALLEPESIVNPPSFEVDALLNRDLLLVPGARLTADLSLINGHALPLDALLQAVDTDWFKACGFRAAGHDFVGARQCLNFVLDGDAKPADGAREQLEAELRAARAELFARQTRLLARLAEAAAAGQISQQEQQQLEARISAIAPDATEAIDLLEAELAAGEGQLAELAKAAYEYAKGRLEGEDLKEAPADAVKRVRALIENGQIELANDYIERLQQHETLPDEDTTSALRMTWTSVFEEFFGPFLDDALRFMRSHGGLGGAQGLIKNSPRLPAFLQGLAEDAGREDASALLDAWTMAGSREGPQVPEGIQRVLSLLRFANPTIRNPRSPRKDAAEIAYSLDCDPINDRDTVIISALGSEASGRYRLVLFWERYAAQQILSRAASNAAINVPLIVFCFSSR